jgi:hypothetical protein
MATTPATEANPTRTFDPGDPTERADFLRDLAARTGRAWRVRGEFWATAAGDGPGLAAHFTGPGRAVLEVSGVGESVRARDVAFFGHGPCALAFVFERVLSALAGEERVENAED